MSDHMVSQMDNLMDNIERHEPQTAAELCRERGWTDDPEKLSDGWHWVRNCHTKALIGVLRLYTTPTGARKVSWCDDVRYFGELPSTYEIEIKFARV